jgi:hypothetical protein
MIFKISDLVKINNNITNIFFKYFFFFQIKIDYKKEYLYYNI